MPALTGTNDLTEDSLRELLTHIRERRITMKPQYITLTDDNLIKLGWTKEAVEELRNMEGTCLL